MDLLLTSLSGLCSLTRLNLSYCNLNTIPNDICCLFSLKYFCLSGNNFSCLPENIAQLSILKSLMVDNCTSLQSWPKLPLNIESIWGKGCTSLETLPDLLQPNSLFGIDLCLTSCSKLAKNQGFIDMFFAMIIKSLQLPLSGMFLRFRYDIIILGSEIPKWFRHQSIGDEVGIQEPYSLFYNECIGTAICIVFSPHSNHQILEDCILICWLIVNGKRVRVEQGSSEIVSLSDHIWLLYLFPQFYEKEDINSLWGCDANGFSQIGIKIETCCWDLKTKEVFLGMVKVKKCRLRMVYVKDIEDLNRTMTERNNNNITPYKANRTHDDYDGAGSSNYEPHPKRIERLTEYMAQCNSNSEESSEYKECPKELGDWQESSESDLEG